MIDRRFSLVDIKDLREYNVEEAMEKFRKGQANQQAQPVQPLEEKVEAQQSQQQQQTTYNPIDFSKLLKNFSGTPQEAKERGEQEFIRLIKKEAKRYPRDEFGIGIICDILLKHKLSDIYNVEKDAKNIVETVGYAFSAPVPWYCNIVTFLTEREFFSRAAIGWEGIFEGIKRYKLYINTFVKE